MLYICLIKFLKNKIMEIKIVKKPLQDSNTKYNDYEYIEYITENNQINMVIPTWCVKNYMFRECNGGMKLWFDKILKIEPNIIYLYEIKAWEENFTVGDMTIKDVIYSIRADLKKINTKMIVDKPK